MIRPLVSIILPTYNGLSRGFLREAIESVIAQTYDSWELLIIDDGSSDDITKGCSVFLKDARIRIFRRLNGGLSVARMTGIEQAKGEYVALLDDDDRWLPEKLARQIAFLQTHPDPKVAMVFTGVRLINVAGDVIGARIKTAAGDVYRQFVVNGNGVTAPSAVLFKREVIETVGNFDPEMKSLEDLDMWLRISRRYHIYSMPELLTDYRIHENTITAKSFEREETYERKLYERILQQDHSFDRVLLESNMARRFAIRHMSLGNYMMARTFLEESMQKRFSLQTVALCALTFFPAGMLEWIKAHRRRRFL